MTQTQKPAGDELVRIFHTGKGHGPMSTASGDLLPGQSLEVPEALAAKLTAAYKHVKLAKDVIPGGFDPKVARENAMLKAEIDKLTAALGVAKEEDSKELVELRAQFDKAWADLLAEKTALEGKLVDAEKAKLEAVPADVAALKAALAEFLGAGSKKDLEGLQAKHKDILA